MQVMNGGGVAGVGAEGAFQLSPAPYRRSGSQTSSRGSFQSCQSSQSSGKGTTNHTSRAAVEGAIVAEAEAPPAYHELEASPNPTTTTTANAAADPTVPSPANAATDTTVPSPAKVLGMHDSILDSTIGSTDAGEVGAGVEGLDARPIMSVEQIMANDTTNSSSNNNSMAASTTTGAPPTSNNTATVGAPPTSGGQTNWTNLEDMVAGGSESDHNHDAVPLPLFNDIATLISNNAASNHDILLSHHRPRPLARTGRMRHNESQRG